MLGLKAGGKSIQNVNGIESREQVIKLKIDQSESDSESEPKSEPKSESSQRETAMG